MAANTEPVFTKTPILAIGQLSTANTARDGSGTLVTLYTGPENGARITRITIESTGSPVSAGMIRIFVTVGAVTALYDEIPVVATVPSNSVAGYRITKEYLGERAINLPSGAVIKASTSLSELFNVFLEGGSY